jgi:cytidine deaminase
MRADRRGAGVSVNMRALVQAARAAADRAYAPYSRFRVGAALLTRSGRVFTGCNVENASYGLTNCAERGAVFNALSEGEREFRAIAVYADTKAFTAPCGACRQVLAEFAPNLEVVLANRSGETRTTTLGRLLPDQFGRRKGPQMLALAVPQAHEARRSHNTDTQTTQKSKRKTT